MRERFETANPQRRMLWSMRRIARLAAAIAVAGACGFSLAAKDGARVEGAVLGARPGYGPAAVTLVPNIGAMDRWIWVPGLDRGWNPQGLTFADGNLLVSAYRSRHFGVNRGPCRVFRIDPATGRMTGHFDVPKPCGHAGGLAYAEDGTLYIADTHTLFSVDLDRAFAEPEPRFRVLRLGRGLTGAFATCGRRRLWIGAYREARPAEIFGFDLARLNSLPDEALLGTQAAAAQIAIPSFAQGATFGPDGGVWISRSEIAWGRLDRLNAGDGRLEASYPAPGGIEGIAFDPLGRLWGVSEAGARHIPLRYPFFPVAFRLYPARLRPGG